MTSITSVLSQNDGNCLVDFSCTDRTKFGAASNEDIWEKFDELSARRSDPTFGKTRFEKLETAAGLNHVRDGVLASLPLRRHLKPVSSTVVDPMHVLVSNGIINMEVFECFEGAGWNECYDDMRLLSAASWGVPKNNRNIDLCTPLDTQHQKASHGPSRTFKCQASEMLSVVPLIRYYVDMKLARRPGLAAQVASFRAAHDLLCSTFLFEVTRRPNT